MILSSRALRGLGTGCDSFEAVAGQVVDFFHESFREAGAGAGRACVLVRCFKTHRFGELPAGLREIAAGALRGATPDEAMMCLTLLASRGVRPEWNSRHGSAGHQVIPLATAAMIERAPMIARLIEQLGLQPQDVLRASREVAGAPERQALDVFHVEEAVGSRFVPAQTEFVVPYRVRSVVGFGGRLPTGEHFFVLLFSRVAIAPETAELFRTLALSVKLVLLRYAGGRVFTE